MNFPDLDKGLEVGGRRRRVVTQQSVLRELVKGKLGDADVGQQHKLLHHGVGLVHLLGLHVNGIMRLALNGEPRLQMIKTKKKNERRRMICQKQKLDG